MAQFLLLCLILAEALFVLALASEKTQTMVQPNESPTLNPPAPSRSNGENLYNAEAPRTRKIGYHPKMLKYGEHVISSSPSEAPQTVEKKHSAEESSSSIQTSPIDPNNQENVSDQGQGILPRKQHHSVDKSIAGGGVILGGLASTFLVAVFCYIRATGRHKDKAVAETVA